ncbi:hypothetical protein EVAR_64249_1 [Eumeta japonica]|uniref:Uncharacterized protein n=1 Tax=Eumeta variegata TaxID=151549 RepID=A0A4C1YTU9_EUMVA|nr:hypothetical protein EVAR_64249_1 [Eumeta japonica]
MDRYLPTFLRGRHIDRTYILMSRKRYKVRVRDVRRRHDVKIKTFDVPFVANDAADRSIETPAAVASNDFLSELVARIIMRWDVWAIVNVIDRIDRAARAARPGDCDVTLMESPLRNRLR